MRKTKEQKQWEKQHLTFTRRHPDFPLIFSIIALLASILVLVLR